MIGANGQHRRRRRLHPELYVPSDAFPRRNSTSDTESTPLFANGKAQPPRRSRLRQVFWAMAPYIGGLSFIAVFGYLSWAATTGRKDEAHRHPRVPQEEWDTSAQVVGWFSAALYLGSRIVRPAFLCFCEDRS